MTGGAGNLIALKVARKRLMRRAKKEQAIEPSLRGGLRVY